MKKIPKLPAGAVLIDPNQCPKCGSHAVRKMHMQQSRSCGKCGHQWGPEFKNPGWVTRTDMLGGWKPQRRGAAVMPVKSRRAS